MQHELTKRPLTKHPFENGPLGALRPAKSIPSELTKLMRFLDLNQNPILMPKDLGICVENFSQQVLRHDVTWGTTRTQTPL